MLFDSFGGGGGGLGTWGGVRVSKVSKHPPSRDFRLTTTFSLAIRIKP